MEAFSGAGPTSSMVGRGPLRAGGALIAAGAVSLVVHSVLMLVGFIAILSLTSGSTGPAQSTTVSAVTNVAYYGAVISVLLGAFLLGAGLLAYPSGTHALGWTDWGGGSHSVSAGTRAKGLAAGVLAVIYGIQGVLALYFLVLVGESAARLEFGAALGLLRAILINWLVAAIVLIVCASLVLSFLGSLRREAASSEGVGGGGFLAYAIVNAVGVFFITLPSLSILFGGVDSTSMPLLPVLAIGVLMEVLVVPIVGIVAFSLMAVHGVRLRRLESGRAYSYVAGTPSPPVYVALVPLQPLPPAPTQAGPMPYAGNLVNLPPPEPFLAVSVANPPPPEEVGEFEIRTQIVELERAIEEQRQLLALAEDRRAEGRLESGTYERIVQFRMGRIAECEREIAARSASLGGSPHDPPPPGPDAS